MDAPTPSDTSAASDSYPRQQLDSARPLRLHCRCCAGRRQERSSGTSARGLLTCAFAAAQQTTGPPEAATARRCSQHYEVAMAARHSSLSLKAASHHATHVCRREVTGPLLGRHDDCRIVRPESPATSSLRTVAQIRILSLMESSYRGAAAPSPAPPAAAAAAADAADSRRRASKRCSASARLAAAASALATMVASWSSANRCDTRTALATYFLETFSMHDRSLCVMMLVVNVVTQASKAV